MKSNLPDSNPWPTLTPEQALKSSGLFFVVSSLIPSVEVIGLGTSAQPVCIMLVTEGKMFICNPTQEVPRAKLAPGLTFQGPITPNQK